MPTRQQIKLAKELRAKAQANLAALRKDKATVMKEASERERLQMFVSGFDAAVLVFEENFFGGPTKEMVLDWFATARPDLSASKN